jgi:hypothetical protein
LPDSENIPGFTHYSEVDWNEYLTVPKSNADVLDRNALPIIENSLKVPVKKHMVHVDVRREMMEVDARFYSSLLDWSFTGFRGSIPKNFFAAQHCCKDCDEELMDWSIPTKPFHHHHLDEKDI